MTQTLYVINHVDFHPSEFNKSLLQNVSWLKTNLNIFLLVELKLEHFRLAGVGGAVFGIEGQRLVFTHCLVDHWVLDLFGPP